MNQIIRKLERDDRRERTHTMLQVLHYFTNSACGGRGTAMAASLCGGRGAAMTNSACGGRGAAMTVSLSDPGVL